MFRERAKHASLQLEPGDPRPSQVSEPIESGTPSDIPSNTPRNGSKENIALQSGAIAGIAIGGSAILILAALLIFFCRRRNRSGLITREVTDRARRRHQNSDLPVSEAHDTGRGNGYSTRWEPGEQPEGDQGYYSHRKPSPMLPMPGSSPTPLSHQGTGTYTYPFSPEAMGYAHDYIRTGSHL